MAFTLAHPEALALLGLGPILVLLHFRRQRPRPFRVPHLGIWASLEGPRARWWTRLLELLSLFLLLAALVALTLGAGGLARVEPTQRLARYVFVVDVSPSMEARVPGGGNRLDRARRLLGVILATMPGPSQVMVLTSDLSVPVPRTRDLSAAVRHIARMSPSGGGRDLTRALDRGRAALAGRGDPGRLVCMTDQDCPKNWDASKGDWIRIGPSMANAGFFDLSVPALPWWHSPVPVSFALGNFSAKEMVLDVDLALDGTKKKIGSFTLPPGGRTEGTVMIPRGRDPVRFTFSLPSGDGLALDDRLFGVLGAGGPRQLVVVTPGDLDPFLGSALATLFDIASPEASAVFEPGDYEKQRPKGDAVVAYDVEGVSPPARGGFLAFGPPPHGAPPGRALGSCAITGSQLFHPVTEGLSFDGVFFRKARTVPGGTPLLHSKEGVLAAAFDEDGRRSVIFGFLLDRSNLPLQADFPLLLRNALRWVMGGGGSPRHLSLRQYALSHPPRRARPGHLAEPGAVNLLAVEESDLRQGGAIGSPFRPLTETVPVSRPLGGGFALAGLGLLLALALRYAIQS
jgi:hypothetical protein